VVQQLLATETIVCDHRRSSVSPSPSEPTPSPSPSHAPFAYVDEQLLLVAVGVLRGGRGRRVLRPSRAFRQRR